MFARAFFFFFTLHCNAFLNPFDPFPESPEAAQGIDPIMGMNDSLGCCSKEKLLALKHVQRIRVDSQVLAFLLLFLALFFLCLTKVDSFLVSVPCQMKHPPRETSAMVALTITNSQKQEQ